MRHLEVDKSALKQTPKWMIHTMWGLGAFIVVVSLGSLLSYFSPPSASVPGKTVKGWGCMQINDEYSASVYYNMTFSNDGTEILLNYFSHEEKLVYVGFDGFGDIWKGPRFTYRNDGEEQLIDRANQVGITPGCMTVREEE
jgi:hypothetical protein